MDVVLMSKRDLNRIGSTNPVILVKPFSWFESKRHSGIVRASLVTGP
jgi:hypothetical protein